MSMTHDTCPRCGHGFSRAAAPGGMCPRCLLFGGAEEMPADFSLDELRDAVPGFRVEAQLGRGGMGAVFRARQLDLDRDVAIKFIAEREDDPAFGERFEREARTMARLNHPNIVTVHSHGRTVGGHAFIVMEYVPGGDLAQLIAAGRIPEAVALGVVEQVCSALAYAHEQGCVHRDIKPGNILLDAKGRVKVADFGLVKVLGESAAAAALTVTGFGVGTPLYAAPEQTKPGAPVDHRADIYALGVMLYEMLTGEVPRGIFQKPSAKSGTLVRWDGIIVRAMDAQPERRFASTGDISRELVVIRREIESGFVPWRRRWKKWALAAAGVAAVAAFAFALLRPADFTIARSAREIVLTDARGSEGALTISQPAPGRIQFSAAGRTFRTGFGWRKRGASEAIPLGAATRIIVRTKSEVRFESDLALSGASLTVEAESVRVAENAEIVTTGTGTIAATASKTIVLSKGARMETQDGSLTLLANPTGMAAGGFVGVLVDGGLVQAIGAGVVAVTGTGGSVGDSQHGVQVEHGGAILGGTRGTTTVTGTGGPPRAEHSGVRVNGRGSTIGSLGADVQVTGEGHSGLHLAEHARITAGGSGKVTVTGTGRDPTSGNYPVGVTLTNNGVIDSAGGDVSVTGTGGSGVGTDISGVFLQDSTIAAGEKGTVTVRGRAGVPKPGSGDAIGVDVRTSRITSAGGEVSVEGAGASAGLRLTGGASRIATGKNDAVTLRADSIRLDSGAVISSGTGPLSIAPRTAGTRIHLGGADAPGNPPTLGLSDAELGRITGGTVQIGDERSGEITVTEPISEGNRAKLPRGAGK